jgi:hypothetical protein
MIDDELVIAVRIRLNPTDAHHLATEQITEAIGATFSALRDLPGTLAGVELTMPTFEPYPITTGAP